MGDTRTTNATIGSNQGSERITEHYTTHEYIRGVAAEWGGGQTYYKIKTKQSHRRRFNFSSFKKNMFNEELCLKWTNIDIFGIMLKMSVMQ